MLSVDRIHAFNDNYIWALRNDRVRSCVVVDPGDAVPVLSYLEKHHLTLSAILITHHHRDHTGGLKQLKQAFNCKVYGPKSESIPLVDVKLEESDQAQLDDLQLTLSVLDVPGHTMGHIAYYGAGLLFCGDTLFAGGCGRLFEGTPEMMLKSLHKLASLSDDTRVYCAHEYTLSNLKFAAAVDPDNQSLLNRIQSVQSQRDRGEATVPSTIALEKETNPFLRCSSAQIQTSAETFCGHSLSTETDVFASIRRWKDNY